MCFSAVFGAVIATHVPLQNVVRVVVGSGENVTALIQRHRGRRKVRPVEECRHRIEVNGRKVRPHGDTSSRWPEGNATAGWQTSLWLGHGNACCRAQASLQRAVGNNAVTTSAPSTACPRHYHHCTSVCRIEGGVVGVAGNGRQDSSL